MRIPMILLGLGLLSTGVMADAKRLDPEARLAKRLEGRVAGKSVDCIQLHDIRSSEIIDRIGILYEGSGGTLYLNRPRSGARSLDRDDILVTNTHSSQLCSIDTVRLVDQGSHVDRGFVALDRFVPYPRPKR